jgi:hypothetical protein
MRNYKEEKRERYLKEEQARLQIELEKNEREALGFRKSLTM